MAITTERRRATLTIRRGTKIAVGGASKRRFRFGQIWVMGVLLFSLPLQVLPDWTSANAFYRTLLKSGPIPWQHVIAVVYAGIAIALIDRHQISLERAEDRRRIAARYESDTTGDLSTIGSWQWQLRTGVMVSLVVLFGSNAVAAEFYYFQF